MRPTGSILMISGETCEVVTRPGQTLAAESTQGMSSTRPRCEY